MVGGQKVSSGDDDVVTAHRHLTAWRGVTGSYFDKNHRSGLLARNMGHSQKLESSQSAIFPRTPTS